MEGLGLTQSDALLRFRKQALKLLITGKIRHKLYSEIAALGEAETEPYAACQRLYRLESREGRQPYRIPALLLMQWGTALRLQEKANGNGEVKLSDVIAEWAPLEEASLIAAYEEAGERNQGLRVAASLASDIDKVIAGIIGKALYPIGLLIATVLLIRNFANQILPQLLAVLPPSLLQGDAGAAIERLRFISSWSLPFSAAFVSLMIAILFSMPYFRGRLRVYADFLPPYSFYKIISSARFLLTLGALLKASQKNEREILSMLSDRAGPYVRERINAVQRRMAFGDKLGTAFYRCGFDFPDTDAQYRMEASADLASFSSVIQELAAGAAEKARIRGDQQGKVLQLLAFGIFGYAIIGFFTMVMTILDAASVTRSL